MKDFLITAFEYFFCYHGRTEIQVEQWSRIKSNSGSGSSRTVVPDQVQPKQVQGTFGFSKQVQGTFGFEKTSPRNLRVRREAAVAAERREHSETHSPFATPVHRMLVQSHRLRHLCIGFESKITYFHKKKVTVFDACRAE